MCVWPAVSKCCRLGVKGQDSKGNGEVQTLQTRTRNISDHPGNLVHQAELGLCVMGKKMNEEKGTGYRRGED